jgi:hypothetical protein
MWYLAWVRVWLMLLHVGLVGHVLRVAHVLLLLVCHAGLKIRVFDYVSSVVCSIYAQ